MRGESGETVSPSSRALVQSRDMTLAEAKSLTRAVTRKYVRNLQRDIWYRIGLMAQCVGMVMLAVSALELGYLYRCCSPKVFWFVIGATALFVGGAVVYHVRHLRGVAQINKSTSPAGTRHLVDAQGYTIERNGQRIFTPWRRVEDVDRRPGLMLIGTSPIHFWPITLTAFAEQDVDGFCAELEQRWKQTREQAT